MNDLLKIESAFNGNGDFIGYRLSTKKTGESTDLTTHNILIFNDDVLLGFRSGDRFIPSIGETIIYKQLKLTEDNQ